MLRNVKADLVIAQKKEPMIKGPHALLNCLQKLALNSGLPYG